MIDVAILLQKDAEARNIALKVRREPRIALLEVLKVVLLGGHGFVQRGVEVVVEVGFAAGIPWKGPAGFGLVRLDLVDRGTRDCDEVGVL